LLLIALALPATARAEETVAERIVRDGAIPVEPVTALPAGVEPTSLAIRGFLKSAPPAPCHIHRLDESGSSWGTVPGSRVSTEESRLLLARGEVEIQLDERSYYRDREAEALPPSETARLFCIPVTKAEAEEAKGVAPAGEKSRLVRARAIFEHVAKADKADASALADRLARLLRGAGVPARVAHGLYFAGDRLVRHTWVELCVATDPGGNDTWLFADPTYGLFGLGPARHVLLGFESEPKRWLPAKGRTRKSIEEAFGISFEDFAKLVTRVPFKVEVLHAPEGRVLLDGGAAVTGRTYRNAPLGLSLTIPAGFNASPPNGVLDLYLNAQGLGYIDLVCQAHVKGIAADAGALSRAVDDFLAGSVHAGAERVETSLAGAPAVAIRSVRAAERVERLVFFVRRGSLVRLRFRAEVEKGSGVTGLEALARCERAFDACLSSVRFEP
jgi:hypothetical protein